MIPNLLFPTPVFIEQNAYGFNKDLQDAILKQYDKSAVNWQSEPNLHQQHAFNNFHKMVYQKSKEVLDELQYGYEDFQVTDMWANVLKPGEEHRPHTHSNNLLSGVYYVDTEKNSPGIIFSDPRPQAQVIKPKILKRLMETSDMCEYTAQKDKLIIFPSWLTHFVPTNKTKKNRVSISFNIMLRGMVGDSNVLQSAVYP
jgi:uncharacterized protein (TIGR02466 family)